MRGFLGRLSRPVLAGGLVFAMAFALYAFSTQPLTGYEPETGAVTEGLVLEGHFWDKEDSPLPMKANIPGKDGHHYARTGILQPLLEAPFFAAGHAVDETIGHFHEYPNAYTFLWFYNPFVAAAGGASRSSRWSSMTRRSLQMGDRRSPPSSRSPASPGPTRRSAWRRPSWPAIMVAFALAVWARRSPSLLSWGLTGFATGAGGRDQAVRRWSRAADRDPALAHVHGARAAREAEAGDRRLPAGAGLGRRDRLVQLARGSAR